MKSFTSLLFSLLCFTAIAQTNFQRIIGGVGDERGHAIIVTQDGGYALAGITSSFGSGGNDICIVKMNAQGGVQWQKTYGGSQPEGGMSIIIMETPDAELIVTGSTESFGGTLRNLFVYKTDADGNLIWSNMYDSGPDGAVLTSDLGRGLLYTRDGDILISGTDDAHAFGSNDALVMKIDIDGNLIWKRVYGGTNGLNDHLQESVELPGGNTLMSGSSQAFGPGPRGAFLLKLNPQGDILWGKTYGGIEDDLSGQMDLIGDSTCILTGQTSSFGAGQSDILLFLTDTSGVVQWSRTYGSAGDDRGIAVKAYSNGSGYLIAGSTTSFSQSPDRDILMLRTDATGELMWAKIFDSGGDDVVDPWATTCLQLTDDGGFVLTGWSNGLSDNGDDILILKDDGNGTSLCEDVDLSVTSPDITTIEANVLSAESGTYQSISSPSMDAAMIAEDVCVCMPDSLCETCDQTTVHYDLNNCISFIGGATSMDYSEFIPEYPTPLSYAEISASIVYRENPSINKHSCTPGIEDSPAMCVGSLNSCAYAPGNQRSVVFELTIVPSPDSAVTVTGLNFFEKAPQMYEWIGGGSGPNNYPTRFAVRVLKNGTEIFRQVDIPTSVDVWQEEAFDFTEDEDFLVSDSVTLRFELLAYCLIGNGAQVDAWDLDEISVKMACEAFTSEDILISGFVRNAEHNAVEDVIISMSDSPDFTNSMFVVTDADGRFTIGDFEMGNLLYLNAYRNTDPLQGVTTLDLIRIQKHLLGIRALESPYQILAADANRSNSVSVMDIVEIRKLILGRIQAFSQSTSWRFGDANQKLDSLAPWDLTESLTVPNAGVDIGNAHFMAIKVGDVTGDALSGIASGGVHTRSAEVLTLEVTDRELDAGVPVQIHLKSTEEVEISGLQLAIDLSDFNIRSVYSEAISFGDEHIYLTPNGELRISWNTESPLRIREDQALLTLEVVPLHDGMLSHVLDLSRLQLVPEVYVEHPESLRSIELSIPGEQGNVHSENAFKILPNPTANRVTAQFYLSTDSYATITFYDLTGRELRSIQDYFPAGGNEMHFNVREFVSAASMIYCQIRTSDFIAGQHLAVLR